MRQYEIEHSRAFVLINLYLQLYRRPIIKVIDRVQLGLAHPLGDPSQQVAHGEFGIVPNVVHVLEHDGESVFLDKEFDQVRALVVGCDLRLEVRFDIAQAACDVHCSSTSNLTSSSRWYAPLDTTLKLLICAPSSKIVFDVGGMEPAHVRERSSDTQFRMDTMYHH
ncbi:BQ5605_C004g02761 [Microbotryum silenes-dioicae]|uniref:BQ5605_C004g02761 protein n=1 Tax=Microbotryum silenes-dioicae TaxID=796604 RepID=A0A2X0P4A1_9BASI|nr:BQ5605_C004g02761 [Microbotryum silenes-dioicae]